MATFAELVLLKTVPDLRVKVPPPCTELADRLVGALVPVTVTGGVKLNVPEPPPAPPPKFPPAPAGGVKVSPLFWLKRWPSEPALTADFKLESLVVSLSESVASVEVTCGSDLTADKLAAVSALPPPWKPRTPAGDMLTVLPTDDSTDLILSPTA